MSASSTGVRCHPTMIKWCLYLRHVSPKAYELLRTSAVIKLPSQLTLRDYTHYISSTSGFSSELDEQLIQEAKSSSLQDYQRHVCLVADEMHVKADLVYDKFTGELVGFSNLGNINQHLQELEVQATNPSERNHSLAKSISFSWSRDY